MRYDTTAIDGIERLTLMVGAKEAFLLHLDKRGSIVVHATLTAAQAAELGHALLAASNEIEINKKEHNNAS